MSNIKFTPEGKVQFIVTDQLMPLVNKGAAKVRRVSHINPERENGAWLWYATIIDGPILGPFGTRGEAISAEITHIENNVICG